MLLLLLHGGWDTLLLAILFWLSPFIVAAIVLAWAIRRYKRAKSN
jgi:hypothetical protein